VRAAAKTGVRQFIAHASGGGTADLASRSHSLQRMCIPAIESPGRRMSLAAIRR